MLDGVSDHELDTMPSPIPPNTLPPTVDSIKKNVPERESEKKGFWILQQNERNMHGLFLKNIHPSYQVLLQRWAVMTLRPLQSSSLLQTLISNGYVMGPDEARPLFARQWDREEGNGSEAERRATASCNLYVERR